MRAKVYYRIVRCTAQGHSILSKPQRPITIAQHIDFPGIGSEGRIEQYNFFDVGGRCGAISLSVFKTTGEEGIICCRLPYAVKMDASTLCRSSYAILES